MASFTRSLKVSIDVLKKVSVYILLTLLPASGLATVQFSREQCQQLNQQRKQIRQQLRQPYTAKQGQQLQAQQQALLRLLQQHCKKPRP